MSRDRLGDDWERQLATLKAVLEAYATAMSRAPDWTCEHDSRPAPSQEAPKP